MYMYICIYRPNVKTKVIKTCAPPGVNSLHDCSFNFSFVEDHSFVC